MAKDKTRAPTPEELELFRRAMADAEKLPPTRRGLPAGVDADAAASAGENTAPPTPPPIPKMPRARAPDPPRTKSPATIRAAAPLAAGVPEGLDRRTMDKLRKGRLRPEARLDLHGMTAAAAHGALGGFLASAQAVDKRCVLVITGKGSLKQGGGIIRRELPGWLNAAGTRSRVLGFAQAQPADGGGGAFYVLLRRRR